MLLQEYLNDTHEFASPEQWGVVQSNIPQQWIEQALPMVGLGAPGVGGCLSVDTLRLGMGITT